MTQAKPSPIPLHSNGFLELLEFCRSITAPYTEHDIRAFNAIYRYAYPTLSREEKQRAESIVDAMIEGLQNRNLASLIWGVV